MYIELPAGPVIDHPALPAEAPVPDKAAIEDLRTAGFISIEFTGNSYLLYANCARSCHAEETSALRLSNLCLISTSSALFSKLKPRPGTRVRGRRIGRCSRRSWTTGQLAATRYVESRIDR
jgi:hypothetical protein